METFCLGRKEQHTVDELNWRMTARLGCRGPRLFEDLATLANNLDSELSLANNAIIRVNFDYYSKTRISLLLLCAVKLELTYSNPGRAFKVNEIFRQFYY